LTTVPNSGRRTGRSAPAFGGGVVLVRFRGWEGAGLGAGGAWGTFGYVSCGRSFPRGVENGTRGECAPRAREGGRWIQVAVVLDGKIGGEWYLEFAQRILEVINETLILNSFLTGIVHCSKVIV